MYHFCNTVYHYCHNSKAIQVVDSAAESTVGITHTLWTMSHFDKRKILASKLLYGVRVIHSLNVNETQEEWKKCKGTSCAYSANYEFHLKGVAIMMKRKDYFTVNSYGGRWIFLLILMLLVFSPHVDGQQGKVRRIFPNQRSQKALGTIKSQIIKDTWHEEPAIRSHAILALGRLHRSDWATTRSPIVDALRRDKNKQVRWMALLVLGASGRESDTTRGMVRAIQEIVASDPDSDLRRFAATILLGCGKLDKHTDKIWKYYLEMLQHPYRDYQDYALEALYMSTRHLGNKRMVYHKLHPAVRTQLEEMARAPQPSPELVRAVSHIWTGRTIGPLVKWLNDEDYELRKTSALALERHSRKDGNAALALLETLRGDSSVKARAAAAKALTGHPSGRLDGLRRREFFPKMQRMVWNILVEAAQNDAPEVRASALLSLANLKEGNPSAWRIFTEALVDKETSIRQKDKRIRIAAIRGLGQAIYLQFNEVIEAVLLHTIKHPDENSYVRFCAVESLLLFNYWDDLLHDVMINLLSDEELRLRVIELWGEYAQENAQARRKLRKAFRQMSRSQIGLYLAMALVKSGDVDGEAIQILVHQGLKDAKLAQYCVKLLGRSGYSEAFVIEALLEKLRTSVNAVGPVESLAIESLTGNVLINILHYGGELEGSFMVKECVEALLGLDKYNNALLVLLPKVIYFHSQIISDVVHVYGHQAGINSFKSFDEITRSLIRQERRHPRNR